MSDIHSKKLTPGEALFFHRRRAGKTQFQFAKKFRVSVSQLLRWEADVVPTTRAGVELPIPKVDTKFGDLTPTERCVLFRRRSGKDRAQVAAEIGVSLQWLSAMERGHTDAARLNAYWNNG